MDLDGDGSLSFDPHNFGHISTYLNSNSIELDHGNDILPLSQHLPDINVDADRRTETSLDIDHRTDESFDVDADLPNPYSIDGHEPLPASHPIRRQSMQPFQLQPTQSLQPTQIQPLRPRDDLEQRRRRQSTYTSMSPRFSIVGLVALPGHTRSHSTSNLTVPVPFDTNSNSNWNVGLTFPPASSDSTALAGAAIPEPKGAEGTNVADVPSVPETGVTRGEEDKEGKSLVEGGAGVAAVAAGVGALALGGAGDENEDEDKGKGKAVDFGPEGEEEEGEFFFPLFSATMLFFLLFFRLGLYSVARVRVESIGFGVFGGVRSSRKDANSFFCAALFRKRHRQPVTLQGGRPGRGTRVGIGFCWRYVTLSTIFDVSPIFIVFHPTSVIVL